MFTRFVLSFKSLNQVISKDAIKKKFEAACLNSTIKGGDYKNFEAVFDLIEKIMKYLLVVAHPDDEVFSEEIDFGGTFTVPLFIFEA